MQNSEFTLLVALAFCCDVCFADISFADITCAPMPSSVTDVSRDVVSDIKASAGMLGRVRLGEVAIRTEATVNKIFTRYPNVDKLLAMQTMAATYCTILKASTTINEREKIIRWERFQDKVLNFRPSRENENASKIPSNQSSGRGVGEKATHASVPIMVRNEYRGIDPEKYAQTLVELELKKHELSRLSTKQSSAQLTAEQEEIDRKRSDITHELQRESVLYEKVRKILIGDNLFKSLDLLAQGKASEVDKIIDEAEKNSLRVCGGLVYDPVSEIIWLRDIFKFGVTSSIFKASQDDKVRVIEKSRNDFIELVSNKSVDGVSQWRIASTEDLRSLKRFNGETLWAAFSHHGINLIGAYLDDKKSLNHWGYQLVNYLQGPYDGTDGNTPLYLNEFGVWLVGRGEFHCDSPVIVYPRSEPRKLTVDLLPKVSGIMTLQNGKIKNSWKNKNLVHVEKSVSSETRSILEFDMGDVPNGVLVDSALVIKGKLAASPYPTKISWYPGDGKFAPSIDGDWEPQGLRQFASWLWPNKSIIDVDTSIAQNAYAMKSFIGIHLSTNEGSSIIEVPILRVTYIPTDQRGTLGKL